MDPKTVVRLLTLAAEGMLAETGAYTPEEINGAGKSTTIRTLLGLLAPTAGSAKVLGLDCVRDREKILAQVGYMPSEAMFYPGMRVSEVIKLPAGLRRMDCRISRLRVCLEKLAALAVLIVGLNLICFACGAGGILAIGEEADWGDLLR
ncbi:MAG: ATP-binding cassette domain-containing protein [Clostridiales bacterium]|nr:ATP-binding cassette domain-containing protein [Clostridiales bacterium]